MNDNYVAVRNSVMERDSGLQNQPAEPPDLIARQKADGDASADGGPALLRTKRLRTFQRLLVFCQLTYRWINSYEAYLVLGIC